MKEDVILEEECAHLRFKKTMAFFDKYGKEIEIELINKHYEDI